MTSAINALVADGNTVIPAGLLWGWRVLSPTVPFTQGAPYDDEKWIKALVLLTDGENMVSGGQVIIAAGIAVVISAGVNQVGCELSNIFNQLATDIKGQ